MKKLESGALRGLTKLLGISGGGETYFDDENLQQVLDVSGYMRRTRTPGEENTGVFMTGIRNTHSGAAADAVLGILAPYTAGVGAAAPARNTWPGQGTGVPIDFDIWLLGVDAETLAVAGNFTAGWILLSLGAARNAELAITGAGATVPTGGLVFAVRSYVAEMSLGVLGTQLAQSAAAGITTPSRLSIPFRIPRGAELLWQTRTAALGASIYQAKLLLGVFPAGFGQDFGSGAE